MTGGYPAYMTVSQALRPGSACSSQLAPFVEAVNDARASFHSSSVATCTFFTEQALLEKAYTAYLQQPGKFFSDCLPL